MYAPRLLYILKAGLDDSIIFWNIPNFLMNALKAKHSCKTKQSQTKPPMLLGNKQTNKRQLQSRDLTVVLSQGNMKPGAAELGCTHSFAMIYL